jgi:hypothetical protein
MKANKWTRKLLEKIRKLYYSIFIKTVKQDVKISIVTLNVTRDSTFCLMNNFLKVW